MRYLQTSTIFCYWSRYMKHACYPKGSNENVYFFFLFYFFFTNFVHWHICHADAILWFLSDSCAAFDCRSQLALGAPKQYNCLRFSTRSLSKFQHTATNFSLLRIHRNHFSFIETTVNVQVLLIMIAPKSSTHYSWAGWRSYELSFLPQNPKGSSNARLQMWIVRGFTKREPGELWKQIKWCIQQCHRWPD